MYGVGCAPHISPWETISVLLPDLPEFIRASESSGAFSWADAGLYLFAGERLMIHLCHEGDIHITSDDGVFLASVKAYWGAKGRAVHEISERRQEN